MIVLQPAADFTDEMSEGGPVISNVYPRIVEILVNRVVPNCEKAIALQNALFTQLEETFDQEAIPDAAIISTFLSPDNVANGFFDAVVDNVSLEQRAKDLIQGVGDKLLEDRVELYPPESNTLTMAPFDDIKALKAQLSYNILDYIRRAKELRNENNRVGEDGEVANHDNAPKIKVDPIEWWRSRIERLPILAPIARMYLSAQASSAASERLFSVAGAVFSDKRAAMLSERLEHVVLMKSWFNTFVKKKNHIEN